VQNPIFLSIYINFASIDILMHLETPAVGADLAESLQLEPTTEQIRPNKLDVAYKGLAELICTISDKQLRKQIFIGVKKLLDLQQDQIESLEAMHAEAIAVLNQSQVQAQQFMLDAND
jgi:hypothetical protein